MDFNNTIFRLCYTLCTGLLLTFVVTLCPAQNYHHQDWWYFGGNRGIHFGPTHPPTVDFNSQMNTWEGCATRSDKAGNLLFYTHGHKIWDATHTQMPTPTGYIYGQTGPINSVRQGANIICDAYRPNQYYVFTIGGQTLQLDSLQYFKVDMNLPGNGTPANPLGDVVAGSERTHVAAGRTEAFTAIRHANKRDWWIISTTSSKIEVFLLNSNGVNTTPVYSGTGGAGAASFPDLGWLRGSHDGTKLYSGAIGGGSAYLFDFNNATGIPSNRLPMPSSNDAEFSPNNRFLYLTHYVGNNSNVVQYDLSLAPALIVPSAITVGTKQGSFGMGLLVGPDRRLYVSQQSMLGIINNPNALGVACNFDNNPLATFGIFSFWQSTGSMLSFHQTWEPIYDTAGFSVSNYTVCAGTNVSFTNTSDTIYDCHEWTFGDPGSGAADTSFSQNSSHIYNNVGTYTVTLVSELGCHCESDTFRQVITVSPLVSITSNGSDMCSGQKRALTGNPGGGTWTIVSGPGTINNDTVTATGAGTMIINYNVNGCSTNQAIIVNASQATATNVNICSGQSIMIHGVSRSTPGIYTQTLVAANGCDSISAVQLNVVPAVQSNVLLNICDGDSIFAGGAWQKLAGSFADTIIGGALGGCDSIINTNLVVLARPVTNNTVSICDGQTANIHGVLQSTSGIYSQTFTAVNGCDSISNVTLDVGVVGTSTLSASICAGDSLLIGAFWVKQTGVYNDTLSGASQSGCDSIVTISLTVNPSPVNSSTVTICQDDSLNVHGTFQNVSGIYTQIFSTGLGCDSISTISLNVIASVSSTDTITICNGDSILIASAYRSVGGTYPDTLFGGSSLGCDSIIYTHLIIENYPSVTLNTYEETILMGDEIYLIASGAVSYLWDNGETSSSIVGSPVATQTICVYGSSNNGCLDTACYAVKIIDPNCEANDLFIPNAFSPNGDGVNDQLCVLGTDCFKSFTVKIYDRWGSLIFTMNGKNDCWNGYYKGKLMNTDVFIYELSGLLHSLNTKRVSGNISLLR